VTHLNRIGTTTHWTIQELIAWDRWGILWITTLAAAVFLATQRKRINSYPLVVNALLPLILYPCVFLFSAFGQLEDHIAVVLSRLLVHYGLNAVLLVSTAVAIQFAGPNVPTSARSSHGHSDHLRKKHAGSVGRPQRSIPARGRPRTISQSRSRLNQGGATDGRDVRRWLQDPVSH